MEIRNRKSVAQKFNIHFFIVALAIAVGVYIGLVDSGKYVSSLDILLLPKDEKTAIQIDKIRGNLITIFERNGELENVAISVEEKNSLINIKSKNYNRNEAVEISKKASQEIINIASKYYNAKNELGLRTIKGETQKGQSNIFIIILISIILGGAISFIVQLIIGVAESSAAEFIKSRKESDYVARDIEDMLTKNKSKIEELSYSPEKKEKSINEEIIEEPSVSVEEIESGFKKAASPQNLPVESFENLEDNSIEENISVPNNLPFEITNETKSQESLSSDLPQLSTKEPTEEEYREKLNQLLKGE